MEGDGEREGAGQALKNQRYGAQPPLPPPTSPHAGLSCLYTEHIALQNMYT